ncbi:MBL fold metallo-hydrolase [Phototrophicus methaneseepsis]|uniref:MBL fold metallo-hydrolase n=1 Tax=Phototrophicus methaneseepsis TaxID=2710758 RepID=A0A7S8E7M6_9CHLR|nr:MBL fold metallo-hydrolase [Phototrophicus methaneseepsis]QPC81861.1 MBL fold metallo-hydrolase [Phototrophicus methaneseepsis]
MLQIGDIEVHILNDVTYFVDAGGPFGLVPRALYSRYMQPNENNLVPQAQLTLFLRVGGKNIVVDTGYGSKVDRRMQRILHFQQPFDGLMRGLTKLGVSPADIDLVINTHLHGDHCTGNTILTEEGELAAAFPNAEYVVQRREYEDASHPNERTRATYIPFNYEPLLASGQMRLLDGDSELAPGVHGIVTPGHTPGHMSVRLESQGQHAAFICDLASYAVHFERLSWMTAYDVEPLITLETKRHWQQWAIQTEATLIFVHDAKRPVGKLKANEEGGNPFLEVIETPIFNMDPAVYNTAF